MPQGRANAKIAIADFLKSKGFKVWRSFYRAHEMYALLLIACNKLNPTDPYKAYRYVHHELQRMHKQSGTRIPVLERRKQERVDLLRRELAMLTDRPFDDCPVEWPDELKPPASIDHDQVLA